MATAKASSEPAFRRDAMLEALAFAAQRFLERPSWIRSIDEILERLGEAVGVSRAYVLENRVGSEPLTTVLRSFWLAPGVTSSFTVGDELGFDDLERWVELLSRGEVVGGPVAGLPPAERSRLEPHGIRSMLLVPVVVVAGSWWGYIGFDDCAQEREWPRVEIDVLRAAGGTLAAAIDRERAETRLREAEATYRSIVETTPAITYQEHVSKAYDVGGSVLYVSPQVERILGYSARDWAEIPGFWAGILHPDDRDAVLQESERTNRSGEPYRQEYRMLASDGRVVWFRDESVLIRDEHGEPQMWQGVMVDITEAKLVEERLREAEERFRALVEHLPAVTYREALVPTAEDFYISPRVTEVFGYSAEEWTWTPNFWSSRLHPQDRDRVMAIDRETNRSGMPYAAEYRFLKADGTYIWIHDESTLVQPPDGPGFWQGFMLDITERKEAENRLAETEERYRLLVERSPLPIYVQEIDPDSGESVTTYLSPANEALIGYTAEEVQADPTLWRRLIHPADRDRVRSADRDTNASGRDFSLEYRMVHRDGRTVWVQDVATLIETGDRRYWQGFMLDITERKEAQDKVARALAVERDAAQRLRAVDEMKNTFLQAVSHDLRTPLAAILGLAVTLERGDLDLEAKDIRDLASRIATNARKLDRMVTDLLDLDRLARGIVEPKLHPTDVGELVRGIVAGSELASADRINLDVEPVTVNVDAAKVERIVENLLANASRYTPDGSAVWVRVRPSEDGVTIVVDDEGPGIAAGMRDVVFEPFRQGPGAPEHAPGVGIGLALVARFAELMGGRAWVEESPAGGASFRVFLADGPRTSAEVGTAG